MYVVYLVRLGNIKVRLNDISMCNVALFMANGKNLSLSLFAPLATV